MASVRIALGFACGLVGISFAAIFVRLALPAPPVVSAFYRTLFASAVLVLWLVMRGQARLEGRAATLALAAGVCFGTDLAFWHTAIVRTSVANATLLVNTTPLYLGLFTWLVLGERPSARFVLGAALALAGAALLLGAQPGPHTARGGDLLALVAAGFYSGYLLLAKAARRGADALPVLCAATLGASGALGLYALALGEPLTGFPPHSWAAMAGAALVSQLVGVLAIVWALRWARATFASVALLGQPVGTAMLGWWLLGESLAPLQILGAAGVLAGIGAAAGAAGDPTASAAPARAGIG